MSKLATELIADFGGEKASEISCTAHITDTVWGDPTQPGMAVLGIDDAKWTIADYGDRLAYTPDLRAALSTEGAPDGDDEEKFLLCALLISYERPGRLR